MECKLFIYLTLVSATFQLAKGGLTTFTIYLPKWHIFFPLSPSPFLPTIISKANSPSTIVRLHLNLVFT